MIHLNANGDSNAVSSTGQMDITGSVNANSSNLTLTAGENAGDVSTDFTTKCRGRFDDDLNANGDSNAVSSVGHEA